MSEDGSSNKSTTEPSVTEMADPASDIGVEKRLEESLKQRQKELAEANQIMAGVLEHTNMMAVLLDPDFNFIWVNRAFAETCRKDPAFFRGRNHFELYPHPENESIFRKVVESGEPFFVSSRPFEFPDQPERGTTYWDWSLIPVKGQDSRVGSLVFTLLEVTQRVRGEQVLGKSEDRFQTLVEAAPIGIFVQVGGRFAYVNRKGIDLFGLSDQSQVVDQPVLERFHPDDRARVEQRIRTLNEDRRSVPALIERCLRPNGEVFHGEFSAVPFEYQGRSGALVFFQDVTSRIRLESRIREGQKLEGIGQLAGGIAHDFNNILAAILMNVEALELEGNLDEETASAIRDIEKGARRAAQLTRQLLMFSRKSILTMKRLDLNLAVAGMTRILNRLIGDRITLCFEPATTIPQIEADIGLLEQILMSLVVNSRDATPRGGEITISTGVREIGEAEAASGEDRRPGRFAYLRVSDNGTGMDEETAKRVFEPFFTTKEVGHGSGLGLATVYGIVAQHGGWVEIQTALGRGTTIEVLFPALGGKVTTDRETTVKRRGPTGSESILVVEDEPSVRRLLVRSLRRLGYQVQEAKTGEEALAVWQSGSSEIALLVTDMMISSGMTGLELAKRLRKTKPALPVILASGYSQELVQDGKPLPERMIYLHKPFETRILARAVRECLDRGKGRR